MSRKKTAETIRREIEREVSELLRIVFQGPRKTGQLDLEAIEMAMRSAPVASSCSNWLRAADPA